MDWIVSGILVIIIIVLIVKLSQKQKLDTIERTKYEQDVALLQHRKTTLQGDIEFCEKQIKRSQEEYRQSVEKQAQDLDNLYKESRQRRLEQLQSEIDSIRAKSEELLQRDLETEQAEYDERRAALQQAYDLLIQGLEARKAEIEEEVHFQEVRFQGLLAPLQQYEKEQQERIYYTIQVPEEYRSDIDYLLTTVSQQVKHPDIISKLVWAEYVKPAMDETIKRLNIEEKGGIYKITNINTGKCYVGKSTNVKKRLQDHFKSSVGISSIADQAVHHAILQEGLWNWTIEIITYCDKDKLNELEKYYIEFFKAQEYGYNKTGGG